MKHFFILSLISACLATSTAHCMEGWEEQLHKKLTALIHTHSFGIIYQTPSRYMEYKGNVSFINSEGLSGNFTYANQALWKEAVLSTLDAIDIESNPSAVGIHVNKIKKLPEFVKKYTDGSFTEELKEPSLLEKKLNMLLSLNNENLTVVRGDQEVAYSDPLKNDLVLGILSGIKAVREKNENYDEQNESKKKYIIDLDNIKEKSKPLLQKLVDKTTLVVGASCIGIGYLLALQFGAPGEQ